VHMRTLLVLVLSIGCVGGLRASSVICSTGPTSTSLISTACGQTFTANEFVNWGAPVSAGGLGQALDPPPNLGQPAMVTASYSNGLPTGEAIEVNSNMTLERFDNTTYAWDATLNEWVSPTLVEFGTGSSESINTFAGQFDAPDLETSSAPYGPNNLQNPFGDNLLGAVPTAPSSNAEMIFTFTQPLYGVAFEVSSAKNANFIATLDAYNSTGGLIGVYQVSGTGDGGICATLNNSAGPVPCNDAPVIEFYDPEGKIASVILTVNDTSGLLVDSLSLDSGTLTGTPESNTAPLIGIGLIVLALAAKRTSHWRAPRKSVSESEG
jgi:hypothetical protein